MQDLQTIASSHIALRANRNGTRLLNALVACVAKLDSDSTEARVAGELIKDVYGDSMIQPPKTGEHIYQPYPASYLGPAAAAAA